MAISNGPAIPAVTHQARQNVVPLPEQVRNVVFLIADPLVVVRPFRTKDNVAHLPAIEMNLAESQCGDEQPGPGHRLVRQREGFAQIGELFRRVRSGELSPLIHGLLELLSREFVRDLQLFFLSQTGVAAERLAGHLQRQGIAFHQGGQNGGDIGSGFLGSKNRAQNRQGRGWGLGIAHSLHPFRLPIVGLDQPHFPSGGLALGNSIFTRQPRFHLPKTALTARERFPAIGNLRGRVRGHPAAVPQIAPVLLQQFLGAGHEHLIRGLFLTSRFRLSAFGFRLINLPGESRLRRINAERINEVFAAQMRGLDRRQGIQRR